MPQAAVHAQFFVVEVGGERLADGGRRNTFRRRVEVDAVREAGKIALAGFVGQHGMPLLDTGRDLKCTAG